MSRPDSLPSSNQIPPKEEEEKVITKILRFRLSQQGSWWNRRFPAILGLLVVVVGLAVSVFLALKRGQASTQATQPLSPQDIRTTNVSFSSLTVSWTTSQTTTGFLSYGRESDLGQTALDDRDGDSGEPGLYRTHSVTLTDLNPETVYFFKIGSGQELFDDQGALFQAKTAPLTSDSSVFDPAYGQVFNVDGSTAEGAIVYLTIPGCSPLSSLVKASGGWLVAKNLSLEEDLFSFCRYSRQGEGYDLLVQGALGEESRVSLLSGLDKPVPDVTLGQDYTFKDLSALRPLGTPQPTPTAASVLASPLPATSRPSLGGDLNDDGVVNTWDLAILKSNFGASPQLEKADLNRDGVVDQEDVDLLLQAFNQ